MTPAPGETVVLGLGNPVVSDDRAGLAVVDALGSLLEQSPVCGVTLRESARGGFELIDLLTGYSRAILVDCLALPDAKPGRIRRLSLEQVAGSARLVNAHEISVGEVFLFAKRLGIPMPEQVEIFAIEGGDVSTLSEEMTTAVQLAAETLAREIHAMLSAWRCEGS